MKVVGFSLESVDQYFGQIDGTRFFIGRRVSYEGGKGLMNITGSAAQSYQRADFRAAQGFWADYIHPTAMAEGGLYHTLNTYDIARFTFSFLQFAAHVPNGDFVLYLRALLQLPLAKEYFPDLTLSDDRICRIGPTGTLALESDTSTAGLQDYLNPTLREVEDTEVVVAAKFVHWAQNDPDHRAAQIQVGIDNFRSKLAYLATRHGLDGADDVVCLVVSDITHQGRASAAVIDAALHTQNPLESLLKIGEPKYHSRLLVIRREIKALTADGTFGVRKYSVAKKDFVLK